MPLTLKLYEGHSNKDILNATIPPNKQDTYSIEITGKEISIGYSVLSKSDTFSIQDFEAFV